MKTVQRTKMKSKIVIRIEKHLDRFEEWDKAHKHPKCEPPWIERVAESAWHAYNDTYGNDSMCPAPGSYAEYCKETHDGDPGILHLVDGSALDTGDDMFNRMSMNVSSHPLLEHRLREEDRIAKIMLEVYDSVKSAGQAAKTTFVDDCDPTHVLEFTVIGSSDFLDLDDDTKKYMSEPWYRRWYEENKKRGLVEFEYSFPKERVKTNREEYESEVLDAAVKAYDARKNRKLSFKDWLAASVGA